MHSYRRLEAWKQAHAALRLTLRATDEAYHGKSRALCRRHLRIAFGSAAEAECLVLAAGEANYLGMAIVKQLEDRFGGAMKALRILSRNPPNAG